MNKYLVKIINGDDEIVFEKLIYLEEYIQGKCSVEFPIITKSLSINDGIVSIENLSTGEVTMMCLTQNHLDIRCGDLLKITL